MKKLVSIVVVSLLAFTSVTLVGCCCNTPKHDHGVGKMHDHHGDK